ncbi:baseplate J/gp47 family protein [Achromobacter seleniivolatilans]|uniref:Baseplate J/gp47 family protein n=1 Tax=Achromobacter seleniivolatilans TaxID=3047478 RepID=A0ABY9M7Y4_9BURK|nr:baseplate J/gp47 family protein [Achromobacter sp. R39]WMD23108.1 baseplate J/gp47 family protein [Achromobacter sp. R39]
MPFPVPAFSQIRSNLLRDLKNYRPDADVTTDSDFFIRATSVASSIEGLYQHQAWMVRQIFPDTADQEYLYMHAAVRGLNLKQAIPARGYLRLTGQPGKQVPEGLQAKRGDGVLYRVTASDHMPEAGSGLFAAEALTPGVTGNADDDTPVTLQVAPSGLDSDAKLFLMRGGVAQETDTELLARLLELIRRPPAGGNRHDYRRWAMEVEGVSDAFVYPLRRGLGTVDVAIVSGDGLPSQDTINRVLAYIDDVRPVTAKGCLIVAPTLRHVDVRVRTSLRDTSLELASIAINRALATQFDQIAPGAAWVRSQSEALVSNVAGVIDRHISSPTANIVPVVNADVIEWLRLGAVTVEPM